MKKVSKLRKKQKAVGSRENFWRNNKEPNGDVFTRLPVSVTYGFIETERNPETGWIPNYTDDIMAQ